MVLRFESQGFWGKKIKQKFCQIATKPDLHSVYVTASVLNLWAGDWGKETRTIMPTSIFTSLKPFD